VLESMKLQTHFWSNHYDQYFPGYSLNRSCA
jgi:hypothetical protein